VIKLIAITEEVKNTLVAKGFSEAEIGLVVDEYKPVPKDLSRFHKYNNKGGCIGAYDAEIVDYLIENENIFVLNEVSYIYQGGVYLKDNKGLVIKAKIQNLIFREFRNIKTIKRIYELLLIQPDLGKKSWDSNQFPTSYINFSNGMLNVKTGELLSHSPRYFSINQIPHKYKKLTAKDMSKYPNANYFLKSSLSTPDMKTLFGFMGLSMSHNTDFQYFLMLLGEGKNGKSLIISVLEAIVGAENISNESLQRLSENTFASSGLFGKTLNTCADLSKLAIKDDSFLKKITGGDKIPCELKGKDAFYFTPYAKLLFSCNRFPHIDDKSEGFRRRTRVISMNKKPKVVDEKLKEKLLGELEYFIFLAVQGYREILETGKIFESTESKEIKEKIAKDGDSVLAFIGDCLTKAEGSSIKRSEVFNEYIKFCTYFERVPVSKKNFFDEFTHKGLLTKRDNSGNYIYQNTAFKIWMDGEQDIFAS